MLKVTEAEYRKMLTARLKARQQEWIKAVAADPDEAKRFRIFEIIGRVIGYGIKFLTFLIIGPLWVLYGLFVLFQFIALAVVASMFGAAIFAFLYLIIKMIGALT